MYFGDAASHGLEIVVSGIQVLLKQVETWRKFITDCLHDIGGQRDFFPEEEGSWASWTERAPLVSRFAVMQTSRDADKGHTPRQLFGSCSPVDGCLIQGM